MKNYVGKTFVDIGENVSAAVMATNRHGEAATPTLTLRFFKRSGTYHDGNSGTFVEGYISLTDLGAFLSQSKDAILKNVNSQRENIAKQYESAKAAIAKAQSRVDAEAKEEKPDQYSNAKWALQDATRRAKELEDSLAELNAVAALFGA